MRPLIDTHAHLYDLDDAALAAAVGAAVSAGVGMIVNTATSLDTAKTVLRQCKLYPQNTRAVIGVSPFDVSNIGDDWEDQLKSLLTDPAVIAVGEIGLDNTNPAYPSIDAQMPIFIRQLDTLVDKGLPVVIHSRGMEKRVAEICGKHGVSKAVFHCFTGDLEAADYIISCGYYISISGIVTYKNSGLGDIVKHIPIDRLLIETDAPYLSPVPHRGKPNNPSYLIHTAEKLAMILGVDYEELTAILHDNTVRALSITPEIKCRTCAAKRPHARVQSPSGAGVTFNYRTNIKQEIMIMLSREDRLKRLLAMRDGVSSGSSANVNTLSKTDGRSVIPSQNANAGGGASDKAAALIAEALKSMLRSQ